MSDDIQQAREFVGGRRRFQPTEEQVAALEAATHESERELRVVEDMEVPALRSTGGDGTGSDEIGWTVATLLKLAEMARTPEAKAKLRRIAVEVVQAWRDQWET